MNEVPDWAVERAISEIDKECDWRGGGRWKPDVIRRDAAEKVPYAVLCMLHAKSIYSDAMPPPSVECVHQEVRDMWLKLGRDIAKLLDDLPGWANSLKHTNAAISWAKQAHRCMVYSTLDPMDPIFWRDGETK